MAEQACRVDVWLWRARFCKTRSQAADMAEAGRIRLTRGGLQTRLDKASRLVKPGDELVFAICGRLTAVRVAAIGARRGPPTEARGLYALLDVPAPLTISPPASERPASSPGRPFGPFQSD